MTARWFSALALVAGACSSQTIGQAFDLKTPVALVPFAGYTRYDPKLHPYVAVASMAGDELRVFDPLENRAVSSPGFSFALSVPTAPRPVLLASASLNDVDAQGQPGADLLVVASAGEQRLQVVDTWEATGDSVGMMRVDTVQDLSSVADPGTQIVAMIGLPSFQPGTTTAAPGRARILVAFSRPAGAPAAKLVAVEFQRGADGRSIDRQAVTLRSVALGFETVSLSRVAENAAPANAKYPHVLFAATPDIVTGSDGRSALGVAQLDVSASDPALWTVKAVDARAPTRRVAAAVVGERYADSALSSASAGKQQRAFASVTLRVYADLDPAGCGPTQVIACGVATLDPLANPPGLAAEIVATGTPGPVFVPYQTYRAPMSLPGVALAMAVAMPPNAGAERCDAGYASCADFFAYQTDDGAPLMRLSPFSGQSWTTGSMVVASSIGSSYVLDLGGTAAPDDVSLLNGTTTKVQATNGRVLAPQGYVASDATPVLGIWDSQGTPTDTSVDPAIIARGIQVTPGFTPDDDWTVTWQGTIPGFALRPAVVGRAGGGYYVAFQTPMIDGRWFSDTNLADGSVGIHALDPANPVQEPGDIVEVSCLNGTSPPCNNNPSGNACPQDTPVLGFLSPATALPPTDPTSFPGGALSLGPTVPSCIDPANQLDQNGRPVGDHYQALVSIRAFGLVLAGSRAGYAGRPVLDRIGPKNNASPSALKWEDERSLSANCSPTNRPACERLSVARKARRFYYPLEPPCPLDNPTCYGSATLADPLVPGPALAFRVGPNPAGASGSFARGISVAFSTLSGVSPMARVPAALSIPNAAISVDRSGSPAHTDEGTWFYVSYTGNTVLGFGPGQYVGTAVSLR